MQETDASTIDWNDGRLLTLQAGTSARCAALTKGELYVALLYNTAQHDQNADVIVVWSNSYPPRTITLPGTTGDAGVPAMVFVSGDDTEFLTISLGATSTATVAALMVSVSMPANTNGISAGPLPADGQLHPFQKYTRYDAIPAAGWSQLSLTSPKTQFVSIQMKMAAAAVRVLNVNSVGLYDGQLNKVGPTAQTKGVVTVQKIAKQSWSTNTVQGNGQTVVWMAADSAPNAADAQIALQGLSVLQALFVTGARGLRAMARPLGLSRLFKGPGNSI
ncbi:hypothetical protein [Tropicibacter sp. S64]|uniref:hypothetical protein n=1 Tax=Tropicibacter sp. S64 TaxID=3415122 RepID=UPI003C7E3446